jgi:flavorubredoxin
MTKAIVVYESKYGNTKLVGEKIVEGMKESGEVEVTYTKASEVDINKIPEYDIILLGSPNHMGGPVGSVMKFINGLKKVEIKEKSFAVFDTYMGKDFEKATNKMRARIKKKVPGALPEIPGVSIKVAGMKGPIEDDEFQKCKKFGQDIAKLIKT